MSGGKKLSQVNLYVDTKEGKSDLLGECRKVLAMVATIAIQKRVNILPKALESGDFLVCYLSSKNGYQEQKVALGERKTMNDYFNSLISHHLDDQINRMLSTRHECEAPFSVYLMLEGNECYNPQNTQAVRTHAKHVTYGANFPVFQSKDTHGTAIAIIDIALYFLKKGPTKIESSTKYAGVKNTSQPELKKRVFPMSEGFIHSLTPICSYEQAKTLSSTPEFNTHQKIATNGFKALRHVKTVYDSGVSKKIGLKLESKLVDFCKRMIDPIFRDMPVPDFNQPSDAPPGVFSAQDADIISIGDSESDASN